MFLEFADDSLGAIAQICKSFKVDPARRDLAKLINMGETASLRVPSERAGVIKKALEDADVTFERFNLSINGGGTATEFIFPKVYEEKVLELMRNGTIKDAVELYENRPGGQVSRKDILEPMIRKNLKSGIQLVFADQPPIFGAAVKCMKLFSNNFDKEFFADNFLRALSNKS
jgi:hypothetical protein